ncbi:hypothetical protein E2C01_078866 [Portunus trituberculatus]|uniref:Uncharacterized protein n=1 Tax=Portunus trituberculatus TaxID=210409 RepID=A0A5B7IPV3_PORTR|nr:hypothetical protein [Portunus trituberculatus]
MDYYHMDTDEVDCYGRGVSLAET